ncbi:MAG: hypothetical protein ACD_75C02194G0002 [uncultured bacterium]|nr:MAG: hypothetical protein ACD_75C02194G0002 [uncultured bacterium]
MLPRKIWELSRRQDVVDMALTYLGHSKVETTMIYTHVVKDMRNPVASPFDLLLQPAMKPNR